MQDEKWSQIEVHFAALHAMPPEEWGSGLAVISDTEVRREVASLLEYSLKSDLAIGLTADAAFGRRIGPYRLVRRLGQGGQGAVFEAARDDGSFEQRVAVKIVRWEIDSDAARARFRSERQILAGLTHPHIGRLLDGGQTEHGTPYLVMEFIEGVPLTEATRGWPTRRKVELFLKVLAAVSYAHQNLIVHRDLKPGNILVTPDGSPKLLDFGIARLLDPDATQTATGQLAMTPQYASPEQVRGGVITTATDLYSLGVILYEMLTGRKPYVVEVTRPFEMARVICEQAPDAPGLGDELDDILLMALRKEPERRYGGAEQFAEDLRRYLDYRPIVARPDTLVYRSRKYMRRQWPLLAGVAAVMLALGGGVVASQYEARRAERRFQDLRSLAHSYLFNIDKRIQNLPGSTDAREEIVRTGLAYLEHLSNEAGHDRDLWAELGAGYLAVGDVLGDPFVSNLGKLDEALAAYRKARDIALVLTARDASDRRSLELLGSSYLRIGDSIYTRVDSTGMLENYKRSVEVGEKLRAAGHPPYEMLAGGYRGIGWSILGQPANPAEALEAYRRGLRAAEQWWEAEQGENSAAALMDAHRDVGQALKVMGDLPGAMEEQRKAEDLAYELHQKHPGNATYAYRLGSVWCGLGVGVPAGGLPFDLYDFLPPGNVSKALSLVKETAKNDPVNVATRGLVAVASLTQGRVLRKRDPRAAARYFREAIAIQEDLTRAYPVDLEFQWNAAFQRTCLGEVLRDLGRYQEALDVLRPALASQEKFLQTTILAQAGAIDNLLVTADLYHLTGDGLRARELYEQALGRAVSLWKGHPSDLRTNYELGACYEGLGKWAGRRGEWREAQQWYGKSADLWKSWPDRGVSSDYDRKHAAQAVRAADQARQRAR